jgi:hypothetical protein
MCLLFQHTCLSFSGNYMEKQRVCPLLSVLLEINVKVVNMSVTNPWMLLTEYHM